MGKTPENVSHVKANNSEGGTAEKRLISGEIEKPR
jgi:hypothetical protein